MTDVGKVGSRRLRADSRLTPDNPRRLAILSGIGALVLITGVAFLVATSISSLINTRKMVDHTHAVIEGLNRLLIEVEDAETRQRGFVITGDSSFLGKASRSSDVTKLVGSLEALVSDDALQSETVKRLRAHTEAKIAVSDTTNLVRGSLGYDAAAARVRTGRGRILMDSVRATVEAMTARELALLKSREEGERSSLQRAALAGALGVLSAMLLGFLAIVLLSRVLRALAEGRRSARYAETLLHATTEGIYGLAPDGTISFVNRAMRDTLGYRSEEMIGKPAHALLHHTREDGSVYPATDCPMYKVLQTGGGGVFDNEIIWRKNGASIPVEYSVNQMQDREVTGGAVVSFRDITDRQMVETALRKEKEAAESANQAKSDFLARMSHELRTPLNSVIGFSNVLLRNKAENLRTQDVSYLERIQKNGVHLLALINDILDLSKIEAGRMEIEIDTVSVADIVRDTINQFETQVQEKGISLGTTIPERLAVINTDPTKLQQVLMNLVGNAIKFTNEGSVEIQVITDPATDKPIAITVRDSGIGIPADRIDAIFDAFEQAERSTTRKYGGTGLGLPISRSLCALLGFELVLSSEVGVGSTFTVDLRPKPKFLEGVYEMLPTPEAESEGADAVLHDKLVLIIDDEADSRMLIAHQIASLGGRSAGASNGEDALRIARDIRPDLITLDLLMPNMDGWAVMKALKSDPALREIPVVIVSLVAREHGKGMVGAMSVLSKPLDRGSLAHALKRGVGVGRVLVVEDDSDSQHLLASFLYEEGAAEVRAVAGADDAIMALEEFKPDLVLLDLGIPQGGGETFIEAIAKVPVDLAPRVIVVTGSELTSRQIKDLEAVTLSVVRKGGDLELNLKRWVREFAAKRNHSPHRTTPKAP